MCTCGVHCLTLVAVWSWCRTCGLGWSFFNACPLSPGQTDLQVDASQHKFAKPELVYGLVKGGQTDSQVGSQVAKSGKFHAHCWLMHFYHNRLLVITLCWLMLGGQMVKTCVNLCTNLSLTKVNASPHKSMQVDTSGWPNKTQVRLTRALVLQMLLR